MLKDKNFGDEVNLKKYQGEDNVSLRNMNIGLWLSEKRQILTRSLIVFLILISVCLFVFSAYQFFIYFKNGSDQSTLIENNLVSPRNIIKELKIESPQYYKSGDKYDFIVKVTNENEKFSAKFQACFNLSGNNFSCTDSFILPSETKYIFDIGNDVQTDIKTLSFEIKNTAWQRFDVHSIPNWNNFYLSRLNFTFSDILFYNINDTDSSNRGSNILEFNTLNNSSYSYYDLPLNIALYEGSQLVSVNIYHLQNFLSGEKRNIKINWPGDYRNVRVEIIPNINILDDSVYLKYQGVKAS